MIKQLHNRNIVVLCGWKVDLASQKPDPRGNSCMVEQLHSRTFMDGTIETDQLAERLIAFIRALGCTAGG